MDHSLDPLDRKDELSFEKNRGKFKKKEW